MIFSGRLHGNRRQHIGGAGVTLDSAEIETTELTGRIDRYRPALSEARKAWAKHK